MTARTATRASGNRPSQKTAAVKKAERRRAAQRRAARIRWLKIAVGVLGFIALAMVIRQGSAPKNDADKVTPEAVQAVATTEFPASDGTSVSLSQFQGAPLVLYFYEGQSCGACQTQLQEIQGAMPELEAAGAHVLGVTMDPVDVSTSVASQLNLSYPIMEDIDHALGSAMGTFAPSGHMGAADQHSVVVLSADGTVAWRQLAGTTMYVAPGDIVGAVKEA
jgi:Peroxiredoxin